MSLDTWSKQRDCVGAASIVALSAALGFDDGFEVGRVIWRNDEMKRGLAPSQLRRSNGVDEDNGENRTIGETANHTQ